MKLKKHYLKYLIVLLLVALAFTGLTVKADTGPKPSVHITINGLTSDTYVSLLAKEKSTGPYSIIEEGSYEFENLTEIELKFYEYAKTNEYNFLGNVKKLTEDNNTYSWTYYPPYNFLVVCYIENIDTFVVSTGELSRYAFSTYYEIDLENDSGTYVLSNAKKNYNYGSEILKFFIRVTITLAIELLLAFFVFKFRGKAFIIIIVTNIITQVGLNEFLNIRSYNYGKYFDIYAYYIFIELLIMILEAIIYLLLIKKLDSKYTNKKIILYAISANLLSFALGFLLITVIPLL